MLQSIRDRTQGWIAGVIVSLLILSFALWGIHSYLLGAGDNNVIAKVNGTEITKNQLSVAYERLRRQAQMQFGSNQLPERAEVGLKDRALQALINLQVLEQASLNDNYRITGGQIDAFLQGMPEFQVKGEFSPVRFQQALSASLFSPSDFIELIKTTLLIDQPRLGIIFTSFSLPSEINDTISLIGQERDIQYLVIPQNYFNNQPLTISEDKIQAYYTDHQNEFKTPEQVSIEYLLLTVSDLAKKIQPTEEQLKNFYNENMNSFAQTKKGEKEPHIQPYAAVKDKVKEAFAHQKAEEEFADKREKIANITYEHPDSLKAAAEELGVPILTTGLFTKDKPGKDLSANAKVRDAAFGNDVLNLQNNSDVIQLDDNSAIVLRVKSHVPASVLELSAVRNQIIDKLKSIAIQEKLSNLANEIRNNLQTGQLLPDQLNAKFHLQWNHAGFIGRHSTKIDQAILDSAFAMPRPEANKSLNYSTTKVANGFAVIAVSAVKPGDTQVPKEQYQAFSDQIQNSQGTLEYELYKNSLMQRSKIVIE